MEFVLERVIIMHIFVFTSWILLGYLISFASPGIVSNKNAFYGIQLTHWV